MRHSGGGIVRWRSVSISGWQRETVSHLAYVEFHYTVIYRLTNPYGGSHYDHDDGLVSMYSRNRYWGGNHHSSKYLVKILILPYIKDIHDD